MSSQSDKESGVLRTFSLDILDLSDCRESSVSPPTA